MIVIGISQFINFTFILTSCILSLFSNDGFNIEILMLIMYDTICSFLAVWYDPLINTRYPPAKVRVGLYVFRVLYGICMIIYLFCTIFIDHIYSENFRITSTFMYIIFRLCFLIIVLCLQFMSTILTIITILLGRTVANDTLVEVGRVVNPNDFSGFSDGEINKLHIYKFDGKNIINNTNHVVMVIDNSAVCSICLMEYQQNDSLFILSCNHVYHEACIKPWFKINKLCPMCKVSVNIDSPKLNEITLPGPNTNISISFNETVMTDSDTCHDTIIDLNDPNKEEISKVSEVSEVLEV